MHAAASYGRLEVLDYLISKGGDVNIADSDGDTPLYTVETVETARYLVEKGAIVDRVNEEGISPITHLSEDFPQVVAFLQTHSSFPPSSTSRTATSTTLPDDSSVPSMGQQSQFAQNAATEQLTSSLLSQVQVLVDQGMDPEQAEEELRRLVGQAVLQGLVGGYSMAMETEASSNEGDGVGSQRREAASEDTNNDDNKRARIEE
ncbi:hypothetical protein K435DRAFT_775109 [Dendrothele bispora CBS 962.96]|uniref:Uncharacterized protein n=1 Tax=Dendrothele bispora (strain CBS 962.96) TaxID=1314807 RepID=A0A4S8MKJ7_DENBC|nr:hypothetical protein K435DRAFT_775109 [Dendrothele bispora CBS 962.96]